MDKLTQNLYTYDPDQFFPIFEDGRLANRGEFAMYKAEQFAGALGRVAHRTLEAATTAGTVLLDHIAQ